MFQLEGRGLRELLRKLQPHVFEDLVALVALYRPGPLGQRHGRRFYRTPRRRAITYELPELEPILRSTYGVIVFQEQVMQIATTLAGFTLGSADLLRRAMGKKKPEVMAEQREHFVRGAVHNGYPEDPAAKIFDLIAYFAGYGFNRSHSVAYALIAYRTAYLKAHFPREFMAALITSDMDNTDKVMRYIGDCRDLGIAVLPPDINEGSYGFTVIGDRMRFGLGAIKGVGEQAITALMQERQEHGAFRSLFDLCERSIPVRSIKVLESLMRKAVLWIPWDIAGADVREYGTRAQWAQRLAGGPAAGPVQPVWDQYRWPQRATPTLEPVGPWVTALAYGRGLSFASVVTRS